MFFFFVLVMLDGELGRVVQVVTSSLPEIFGEATKLVGDIDLLTKFIEELTASSDVASTFCDDDVMRTYFDPELQARRMLCDADVITKINDEIVPLGKIVTETIQQVIFVMSFVGIYSFKKVSISVNQLDK